MAIFRVASANSINKRHRDTHRFHTTRLITDHVGVIDRHPQLFQAWIPDLIAAAGPEVTETYSGLGLRLRWYFFLDI
jgi:hypothetical protein